MEAWYRVCAARRRDDRRSGMVLLDLGGSRMLVPDNCLEFRAARRPAPPSARAGALIGMAALAIGSLATDR